MIYPEVLMFISLLVLFTGSFTDLKRREVPDWLSFGLIFTALGIRGIFSFESGGSVLFAGVLGLAASFLIASILYYTNQWGGGDSKLLMGVGAIIGISYPFSWTSFTLLWFFLALLFIGAFYGLIWMIVITIRKPRPVARHFRFLLGEYKGIHLASGCITGFFILSSLKLSFLWPLAILPLTLFYLYLFIDSVEETSFYKELPIGKLTEGDWLAEEVFVGGKKVVNSRTLERNDLGILKQLQREGRLKSVLVKEGLPLVPSFLLAYLLINFGMEGVTRALATIF